MNPMSSFGYNSNGSINTTSPLSPHSAYGEIGGGGGVQWLKGDYSNSGAEITGGVMMMAALIFVVVIGAFVSGALK